MAALWGGGAGHAGAGGTFPLRAGAESVVGSGLSSTQVRVGFVPGIRPERSGKPRWLTLSGHVEAAWPAEGGGTGQRGSRETAGRLVALRRGGMPGEKLEEEVIRDKSSDLLPWLGRAK